MGTLGTERTGSARGDDAVRGGYARAAAALRAGRLDEARLAAQHVLTRQPAHADAMTVLGIAALREGRPDAALPWFRRAAEAAPDDPACRGNLQRLRQQLERSGRPDGSGAPAADLEARLAQARRRVAAAPDDPAAHADLAETLLALAAGVLGRQAHLHGARGDHAAARAVYERLTQIAPLQATAWSGLGATLTALGTPTAAQAPLARAIALDPRDASALNNAGLAAAAGEHHREALAYFERALAVDPHLAAAQSNRGLSLLALGELGLAAGAFARAVAIDPDCAGAHVNLGVARLAAGHYADGWPEYEWRWRLPAFAGAAGRFAAPRWQGEDLAGRTILLHAEQGLGDAVQFLRFARAVADRAAQVLLEVPATLVELARSLDPRIAVFARGQTLPSFHWHCPLMSLPGRLGTELQSIPATPYLRADAARRALWRERLGPRRQPRIGLVWAGSPQHPDDGARSLPAAALAPLLRATPAQWVSLQVGPAAAQRAALGADVFDAAPWLASLADTAAAIAELDLVVGVDTAVMHLTGALGQPGALLLADPPDWRWLRQRADSPWYPSLRLYRQRAAGHWECAIGAVAAALAQASPAARVAESV